MSLHNLNKHILQVWLWLLGISLALLLTAALALQHPYWQRYAARKATGYLSGKLQTQVRIGSFGTDWRHHVVLRDFYLEDQHGDTLLFAKRLGMDLGLSALLRRQLSIRDVALQGAFLRVTATLPDSAYNFDFVRAAFSPPAAAKADTAVSLTYNFGDLRLDQLRVQVRDSVRGNYIGARIGHFGAKKSRLRPRAPALQYELLTLAHATIQYRQTKPGGGPADSLSPGFGFKEMRLNDVRLDYAHTGAARQLLLAIGTAQVLADTFNLRQARIGLASFQLRNSSLSYYQKQKQQPDSLPVRPAQAPGRLDGAAGKALKGSAPGWLVDVKKLSLRNLRLAFGNGHPPAKPRGRDLHHLQLSGLDLELEALRYRRQSGSARLQSLSFREQGGLEVKQLRGELQTRPGQVLVRHAHIQTSRSQVTGIRQLQYSWPGKAPGRTGTFLLDATLAPSVLGAQDLAYLAPYLPAGSPLPHLYRHDLRVQGKIAVLEDRIQADHLRIRGLSGTDLYCSGQVSGLAPGRPTRIDLQVHQLRTNRQDAQLLLPAGTLPAGLTLPDRLRLSGHITGGSRALVLQQVRVKASDGASLETSGTLRHLGSPQKWLDLQVAHYSTSGAALLHLLPPHTVSPDLQLPDKMFFSGTFQGASLQRFSTRTAIRSSFGQAALVLKVQPGERLSGSVQLSDFELGKFLREEKLLGRATGQASFSGQGLRFATTRLQFDAYIRHITYNRAPYRNIRLNGTLDREVYEVQGSLAKVVAQRLGNKLRKLNPTRIKLPWIRKRFGTKRKQD